MCSSDLLAALHERQRSGRGQAVDVAMTDCLFAMMMDEPLDCYESLGLDLRQGNRIMRFSPFNAYRAKDGWITIGTTTPTEWNELVGVMGREELASDPDYSQMAWRLAHNEEVDALISEWTAPLRVSEIMARLDAKDVPCAPVRTPTEALQWPQFADRDMVRPLLNPDGADTGAKAAGLPLGFSRSAAGHSRPAPRPNADTQAVFQELLGLDANAQRRLRDAGVI